MFLLDVKKQAKKIAINLVNEFILRTQEKPESSNSFYVTADGVSRFISQLISGHDQHAFISRVIDRNAPKHLTLSGTYLKSGSYFAVVGLMGGGTPDLYIYI